MMIIHHNGNNQKLNNPSQVNPKTVDATTVKDVGTFYTESLYETENENSSIPSKWSPFQGRSIMDKGKYSTFPSKFS